MNRVVEIHDGRGSRKLSDRDLPLVIGAGEKSDILLPAGRETEAYIGIARGHLFLQPAADSSPLFHNDALVDESVWIKSGDMTMIGDQVLSFTISGDRIEIRLSAAVSKAIAPPAAPPDPTAARPLPRVTGTASVQPARSRVLRGAAALLVLLLLTAVFMLAARPLVVSIQPEPDSISISRFPPVIKIGQRYLGLKGRYTVKASKQGYEDLEEEIVIAGRTTNAYAFVLTRLPGRIDLHTGPVEEAEVFIDGAAAGRTPLHRIRVPAGEHRLLIRKDRYVDLETTITVEGLAREQRFDFALTPNWSAVSLTTSPEGATVLIDGEEKGDTPVTVELPAGAHRIEYRREGYAPLAVELDVPAGGSLAPPAPVLRPAPALLSLDSSPSGATVTVDGAFQGTTPLELELSPDEEHTLTLSRQGHANIVRTVRLAPGENGSLSLILPPESGTIFLTTHPPDAELYIDGKLHGPATGRLVLPARTHILEFQAEGYKPLNQEITPAAGYSRQLEIRLEPEEPALAAAGPKELSTRDGRQLVRMEPAVFEMGASRRDPGRRANERLHRVQITRAFYIGVHEVTNGDFRRFKPDHSSGGIGGVSLDHDNQPVVNVSWEDAVRYLNWLSLQEGLAPFYAEKNGAMIPAEPPTTGYRLPFEAEWSFAARQAGRSTASRYPWSGTFPPPPKSGNFADESARGLLPIVIQGYNDSFPATAPVASFPRDPGGLFDAGGNVSEWCHDYYSPYAGLSEQTEIDPTGPATGTHHVVRGSSWRDGSITELRLSYRTYSDRGRDFIGFRIARSAP
ncbi:MAG TPA: PEGA domain-containing protein [Desulfobacteraceae bacterium]|nr:PEGA domain-containing protein [Desulfobacteraceae bacterium]